VTAWRLVDRPRVASALRAAAFDRNALLAAVFISVELSVLIGAFLSFVFFVPRASRLPVPGLVVGRDRAVRQRRPPCGKLAVLGLEGELLFGAAPELQARARGAVRPSGGRRGRLSTAFRKFGGSQAGTALW
jgi:MFS superfamily sulfate permease-like transporter